MIIEQSDTIIIQAVELSKTGQVEKAITILKQVIERAPKNMGAREHLGDIYYEQEDYKQARRQYRYIYDRRRHEVDVALKLSEVYLCLPSKLRQAYNVLRRTTQHNQGHLEAWQRYANFCRILIREEDDDVTAMYEHIEGLSRGNVEQEIKVVNDYLFTKQYERALAGCQRIIALAPQDSRAYHLLYAVHLEMEAYEAAGKALEKVFSLTEATTQLYHDQAILAIKQGDLPAACAALQQAVQQTDEPQYKATLLRQLATLQLQQEAYGDALQSIQAALRLEPEDVPTLYNLVVVHQQMTDYAQALSVLETQIGPLVGQDDHQHRHLQGVLYLLDKKSSEALSIFSQLLQKDKHQADYHYGVALAYHQMKQNTQAKKAVTKALRNQRRHAGALALYNELHQKQKSDSDDSEPTLYFDPLDLATFFSHMGLTSAIDKLTSYIQHRYWKLRDSRGVKPEVSHRSIVLILLVMGIKDWNFNQLFHKLQSQEKGAELRRLLLLPDEATALACYTTYKRRLNSLGIYPLKFLMRSLVRTAISEGFVDISHILLDTSLIAACTDSARFFPDSPTGFSEPDAAWSYPKPWTGRVFGFKLSLASAKDGEPLDASLSAANPNDITLGKQAVRRLGRLLAPLDVQVEFVLADAGYCSDPLRNLVSETLGALPLFHFNRRRGATKKTSFTYLDDPEEWLKSKRNLRSRIERSFAQLKRHFGLNNLHIRSLTLVSQYILSRCLAYIACVIVAHRVGRPDLKASPKRLLWSY